MLTVFQLKCSRYVLGIGVRELGAFLGVSRTKISSLENMDINYSLPISIEQNNLLTRLFNDKSINFPTSYSVELKSEGLFCPNNISRFQLRGSRSTLSMSQQELSSELGIKKSTINLLESHENSFLIDDSNLSCSIEQIISFFQKKGLFLLNNYTISLKALDSDCHKE
jgi:DNA-binding XRE family transcriptional regulator